MSRFEKVISTPWSLTEDQTVPSYRAKKTRLFCSDEASSVKCSIWTNTSTIWTNTSTENVNKILKLQKRPARIIVYAYPRRNRAAFIPASLNNSHSKMQIE